MSTESSLLSDLLRAELSTLERVKKSLEAEYQSLISNSIERLETATVEKNTAIAAHRSQQEQRLGWMRGQGLTENLPLGELVAEHGNKTSDVHLHTELIALASHCQDSNRRNGGLILRLQERARGALDVLRQDDGGPDLYSLSGSKEHQSDSRTLGKA